MRSDTEDYRAIFQQGLPLMDTRAPTEFEKGAFPNAVNLPLLDNEERHAVGIRYREAGQQAAIELGEELVSAELRERRTAGWCQFAQAHPDGYLYCFRGGLRSRTAQQWMRAEGVEYPLIQGGYKAMRRFLLEQLEASVGAAQFLLIAGKTGTGKTRLVAALERSVDLEHLARHRGSTFGHLPEAQPSQIDFENALSIALLRFHEAAAGRIVLEDEGRLIGRLSLPQQLREKMQHAELLVVEESLQQRVQVILEDYIGDLGDRYRQAYGEEGVQRHESQLLEGLSRIRKRLGGALHAELERLMQEAFDMQARGGDDFLHRRWIESLLLEYYDPMYEYQMSKREGTVLGCGNRAEITAFARELTGEEE